MQKKNLPIQIKDPQIKRFFCKVHELIPNFLFNGYLQYIYNDLCYGLAMIIDKLWVYEVLAMIGQFAKWKKYKWKRFAIMPLNIFFLLIYMILRKGE